MVRNFSSQSLGKYWQLNLNKQKKKHTNINWQQIYIKISRNKQQGNERSTLRQREIEPGLVALYDTRPVNGAGLFLQPRSPHGPALTEAVLLF